VLHYAQGQRHYREYKKQTAEHPPWKARPYREPSLHNKTRGTQLRGGTHTHTHCYCCGDQCMLLMSHTDRSTPAATAKAQPCPSATCRLQLQQPALGNTCQVFKRHPDDRAQGMGQNHASHGSLFTTPTCPHRIRLDSNNQTAARTQLCRVTR